jgi:hypothetical protein
MTGRVLFALVWVIIAAGIALPLYPRDLPEAMVAAAADPVQLVAGSDEFACEDCVVPDTGPARCKSPAVPAVFVPLEHGAGVTIGVVLPTGPSRPLGAPRLLSPKLPAI